MSDTVDLLDAADAEIADLKAQLVAAKKNEANHYAMAVAMFWSGNADGCTIDKIRAAAATIQAIIDSANQKGETNHEPL